jgi:uncharacterized protein (DUF924 family)
VTRFGPRAVRASRAARGAESVSPGREYRAPARAFSMSVSGQRQGRAMESEYRPVIDFWFRELTPRQWFMAEGAKLDDLVRARFGALVEAARRGALDHWAATPRGRLALIIVLDQFPRHVHRGTPAAYASDAKAQALACEGIEAGVDEELTLSERHFFYLPLMHAEDVALQERSIERYTALRDAAEQVLGFAREHRDVVARFGRFPYRNAVLGRESTPEETAYLASDENPFR